MLHSEVGEGDLTRMHVLREIAKAKKNRAAVAAVLAETGTDGEFSKSQGLLLLAVSTKVLCALRPPLLAGCRGTS